MTNLSPSRSLLYTPAMEWIRMPAEAERVVDIIQRQLSVYKVRWRPDELTDYRGNPGLSPTERLIRWDYRHPDDVFEQGFLPQVQQPPTGDSDPAYNLANYVFQNTNSTFVGTARMYRVPGTDGGGQDPNGGRNTRWVPRSVANRFEYEIFAHGGIDINETFGPNHPHANQREIAFPGGIRCELIRTARQYDASGHVVALWANPNFNLHVLGPYAVSFGNLPYPVFGPNVPVHIWQGPSHDRHSQSSGAIRSAGTDFMEEPGGSAWDVYLYGIGGWRAPHAFLALPGSRTWCFSAPRVALIADFAVLNNNDHVVVGSGSPGAVEQCWYLPWVDAAFFALPESSYDVAYLFFDNHVVEVEMKSHKLLSSGRIADRWPALARLGFTRLDAALPVSGGSVVVFSGDKVGRISRDPTSSSVDGPRDMTLDWPGLGELGFRAVSAAHWMSPDQVMFFSGSEYGVLASKGHLVFGPRKATQDFKSLRSISWE